jgi:hypothetical protein
MVGTCSIEKKDLETGKKNCNKKLKASETSAENLSLKDLFDFIPQQ